MKLPESPNITITEFNEKFAGKVVRCKKFNRKKCWETSDVKKWYESVQLGWNVNPLIYIDIQSCINYCVERGLGEDVKYFSNYLNDGYVYITIEGGNRHDSTVSFHNNEPLYRDKLVKVAVIESVTREEMHEGYVRLAHGKSPNPQEKRTGIYGIVSDTVRNTSQKLSHMFNSIGNVDGKRMRDDELVAMLMNYCTNGSFGRVDGIKQDDVIDTMYETSNYNKTKFNYLVKQMRSTFDSIIDFEDITKKQNKTIVYLLTLIFFEIKDKYKVDSYDLLVKYWFQLYTQKFVDSTILYEEGQKSLSFSQLMTGLVMDSKQLEFMKGIVCSEFIPLLQTEGAISPTNPDEFTHRDRINWINKHKFTKEDIDYVKVRCNTDDLSFFGDGTPIFKTITISEAFNGTKYELDHIIPKVENGPTTIENGELTTRDYNRKKSKKVLG
jgi:hypothetical protein|tara:strand:+ start:214 stop:1530 length:1317 start_codon:yes stop_codon:yes gene_type:complete